MVKKYSWFLRDYVIQADRDQPYNSRIKVIYNRVVRGIETPVFSNNPPVDPEDKIVPSKEYLEPELQA